MRSLRQLFIKALMIVAMAAAVSPVLAGSNTGADFLKIPIGARGLGMGQAYSALAEGADSLNWNTAGIFSNTPSMQTANSLSVSHQELFFGNSLDHLAFVMPSRNASIGFSITRLAYPDQQGRDADRNETGSFSANDLALGLALATRVDGMRIGTQLKFIRQQLSSEESTGLALDMGLLSRTPISRLQLGASVKNIGPSMQFISEEYALPLTISAGAAYQVTGPLILALEVRSMPRQKQTGVSLGTEFSASDTVALRAGYLATLASAITNSQKEESTNGTLGGLSGLNAGLGIKLTRFNLDYAFSPFGEIGNTHTFTLSTTFGGSSASATNQEIDSKSDDRQILILENPATEKEWLKSIGK